MYTAIDRDVYIYRLEAAIEDIGTLIIKYRFKRSLIVFDRQIDSEKLNALKTELTRQGVKYQLYETADVTFHLIDEGYRVCLSEKIDSVIGIGGFNALDCAKGINLLRFNGGSIQKYTNPNTRRNPGSGLFCIPLIEGDDEQLLLSLHVTGNHQKEHFRIGCYCNYHIKIKESK